MSDHLEQATDLRRQAKALTDALPPAELQALEHQDLLDLWVALKRAANSLYTTVKQIDPLLLSEVGHQAKVLDSTGWPVEIRRRFETELTDEDAFSAWAADRGVDPFEMKVSITKDAREAVREALLDDGERVPGVSAGYGNPHLSLGRSR